MAGNHRILRAGAALLLATAAAVGAGAAGAPPAPAPAPAGSTLLALTIPASPELGVGGFTGRYGTAGAPDTSLPGSWVAAELTDPEGVLEHGTLSGTPVARTGWSRAAHRLTARARLAGAGFGLAGAGRFLSVGRLDSYAVCARPRSGPVARARVSAGRIRVLDTEVAAGTTRIGVTGSQLGLSSFASGTLSVTVAVVAESPTRRSARGWLEVAVTGRFRAATGEVVYEGPVFYLAAGEVSVWCRPAGQRGRSITNQTPTAGSAPGLR